MKYIISFIIMFILLNCNIEVKQAKANENADPFETYREEIHDSMKYGIWHSYKGGYTSANLTKDALEVELLKKQLSK